MFGQPKHIPYKGQTLQSIQMKVKHKTELVPDLLYTTKIEGSTQKQYRYRGLQQFFRPK